ncbi:MULTISPECIES: hypothetical protein [Calothrix]|uniref:DUF2069 domain-containing protein n=2 Tax=Calothrix TaxID=1186 RepID=A0ABR8AIS9_9CYAN|nr:hypothetical protein [Calothrix anomala]MBD2199937.1 hypothetical protein [Calothrix parietina FACHB-288]MBD2228852.1 hypothetical protein [Calothrix anomala FACHB-343]
METLLAGLIGRVVIILFVVGLCLLAWLGEKILLIIPKPVRLSIYLFLVTFWGSVCWELISKGQWGGAIFACSIELLFFWGYHMIVEDPTA